MDTHSLTHFVWTPITPGMDTLTVLKHPLCQACQTSADLRNSVFFYFPGVIFVIRPDPMRKYFVLWGWGGGGIFQRNFELKMENDVNFWWNVLCF